MKFTADFHIHSCYSRATSRDMNLLSLAKWAKIKGIKLIGTGDFTHPEYFSEIKKNLKESSRGLFCLQDNKEIFFILTTEISNVFTKNGRCRKIHSLLFAPAIEAVEKINQKLRGRGNIDSDGRPIFGFDVKDLVKLVLDVSSDCFIVPAHIWTPWFSLFGANSGFDTIEECFEEESGNIFAAETGLSSDPEMNWRLSALDRITLISNSDAHSPPKLGREANVFDSRLDYFEIREILKTKDKKKFLYTIEFFPEEGKYHYDGHRSCNVLFSPEETFQNRWTCPVCKKRLTIGVLNRVHRLADRPAGFIPENVIPFKHVIPLEEILAEVFGCRTGTVKVRSEYEKLIAKFGSEFEILIDTPIEDLRKFGIKEIGDAVMMMREGKVNVVPGYDGVFGKIKIFSKPEKTVFKKDDPQIDLF